MAQAFSTKRPLHQFGTAAQGTRLKVLVTGADGNIGSYFAMHSDGRYDLRLAVKPGGGKKGDESLNKIRDCGELIEADVTDLDAMKGACSGMDVVLHLAANPSPGATWDSLLPLNIVGTYNAFAAAKACGVRRVVYASSIHAVSGYPKDVQVKPTDPVNPGDLYGVTKCFGEAMGRYMAEKEGVSCIAVRIGAFQPVEKAQEKSAVSMMDAYVSRRDLNQLLQRAVEAEHLKFAIVMGLSDNRFKRLDITSARELLGYAPQDDLTEMNPDLAPLHLRDQVQSHGLTDESKSGLRNDT